MNETSDEEIRQLVGRTGWNASSRQQLEVCARMEPWRKVEQMLSFRRKQIEMLERRLRREHRESTALALRSMVEEHLALVRENKQY